MRHAKKQESMAYVQGEKQSIKTVTERPQASDLLREKDFKSPIINMFKELREIIFKEIKENMRMISHQVENISKEIEIILFLKL